MEKIDCCIVKDLLPLYADGVVSDESAALVREHLAGCESCRGELEALKKRLVLPETPKIQEESVRVLKGFRRRWKKKKLAIACLSAALTALILVSGYLVYQNVGAVHDRITPTVTVTARGLHTGGEWQRLEVGETGALIFRGAFCEKKATLDGNSESAVSLRILDENGTVVVGESLLQPGKSLDLSALEKNREYTVEVKADADFTVICFY